MSVPTGALTTLATLLSIAAITLPILAGVMLLRRSRGKVLPYPSCGRCGYDVSATLGTAIRCPECGGEFAAVGITPPAGKRNPAMLWIGTMLVALPLTCASGILALRLAHTKRQTATIRVIQATPATAPTPASPPAATPAATAPDQP